jgi:hypothetical protein
MFSLIISLNIPDDIVQVVKFIYKRLTFKLWLRYINFYYRNNNCCSMTGGDINFVSNTCKLSYFKIIKLFSITMKKKSLNCLNWATFRKLSDYNIRKKLLNFQNVAQLRQFSDFFIIVYVIPLHYLERTFYICSSAWRK